MLDCLYMLVAYAFSSGKSPVTWTIAGVSPDFIPHIRDLVGNVSFIAGADDPVLLQLAYHLHTATLLAGKFNWLANLEPGFTC
jgi:hypothetical protein